MSDSGRAQLFGRVDLASSRLGAAVLEANDDFFAPKENLIKPEPAIFIPDKYTDRGKWMDGWESRRRRVPGNDWCVIRLGAVGHIDELIVDTAHFTGNHPESASVDGWLGSGDPDPAADWREILPRSPLEGGSTNRFAVRSDARLSHIRLNIFPDGGVARLRAYGQVLPDWDSILAGDAVDLVRVLHGGTVVECSDRYFSAPENLLLPGDSRGMHDGWETRRRRGPGHDWCVVALGRPGTIRVAEVHTSHFKGNYPDRCSLEVAAIQSTAGPADVDWIEVLGPTKLEADHVHRFEVAASAAPATHARLNIYPDGGIARMRLFGDVSD